MEQIRNSLEKAIAVYVATAQRPTVSIKTGAITLFPDDTVGLPTGLVSRHSSNLSQFLIFIPLFISFPVSIFFHYALFPSHLSLFHSLPIHAIVEFLSHLTLGRERLGGVSTAVGGSRALWIRKAGLHQLLHPEAGGAKPKGIQR